MKLSELKKLIREEVHKGLKEATENANDLKKQIMNAIKANWKTTWAAKSPKFNLKP